MKINNLYTMLAANLQSIIGILCFRRSHFHAHKFINIGPNKTRLWHKEE